jgi:hypothetical protein
MREAPHIMKRRTFLSSAAMAAAGCVLTRGGAAEAEPRAATSLFNGKSLKGWIQIENSDTSFSGSDITDLASLAKALAAKQDAVAAFLNAQLDDAARTALLLYSPSDQAAEKALRSALSRNLNKIIAGPSIYDKMRFHGTHLSAQTKRLVHDDPQGKQLVEFNRALLADAFPAALASPLPGWTVKDGAMASTGAGRGVIYTAQDYGRFRLTFTMRHVSGNPDHQACVLIFCTRPAPNELPLDALGGIQFQAPKGGHWDYRPGHNNAGGDAFTTINKVDFDPHQWSRVEILADASTGTARMAVAQPLGSKAVEVVNFRDPTAGKAGPLALQMHNAGLFDEYKDITIETDPKDFDLVSIR